MFYGHYTGCDVHPDSIEEFKYFGYDKIKAETSDIIILFYSLVNVFFAFLIGATSFGLTWLILSVFVN